MCECEHAHVTAWEWRPEVNAQELGVSSHLYHVGSVYRTKVSRHVRQVPIIPAELSHHPCVGKPHLSYSNIIVCFDTQGNF